MSTAILVLCFPYSSSNPPEGRIF